MGGGAEAAGVHPPQIGAQNRTGLKVQKEG